MKYEWILFDADGTLFDYDSAEAFALEATLKKYGFNATSEFLRELSNWLEFVFIRKIATYRGGHLGYFIFSAALNPIEEFYPMLFLKEENFKMTKINSK